MAIIHIKLNESFFKYFILKGVAPTILFSNRYYIREVHLHSRMASVRAHNLTNAVALDYDWLEQCLYWSDVTEFSSSLKRLCGNDTSQDQQQVRITKIKPNVVLRKEILNRLLFFSFRLCIRVPCKIRMDLPLIGSVAICIGVTRRRTR